MHWADAIIVATPIRWGAASSLYFKMAERLNCVQNSITIRNQVLIRNKVAGFIIVGGQDNIQGVAGQMLGFFAELGFIFPQFPYVAHSRGWSSEDMERNVEIVRQSEELAEGASMLARRCVDLAAGLIARDHAPSRDRARRTQGPYAGIGAGRGQNRLGLIVAKLLQHGACRFDHAGDDGLAVLRRRQARVADHARVGEPLVAARPRPARRRVEDRRAHRATVRRRFEVADPLAAHQVGRERQHHRGLVLAGMDFRHRRVLAPDSSSRRDAAHTD